MAVVITILISFILANIPWFSNKFFFIKRLPKKRALSFRIIQIAFYLILTFLISVFLERYLTGMMYPQGWEFYVTFIFLFIIYSFPGIIYRVYKGN